MDAGIMDVDTTVVIVDMDVFVDSGAEGGDMDCFPLCRSFSVPVLPSTGYTRLGRLTIVTATGRTITRTLVIDPGILSEQDSTITLQM